MNVQTVNRFGIIAVWSLVTLARCWGVEVATSAGVLAPSFQHFVDERVMAGAVMLVADKEKVLDVEAVGCSDLTAKKPMQTDDLFWIASMTKSITAAVFMMLVDEGRVQLDDPVEKYIPEFKDLKVAQTDGTLVAPSHPLKVREILSHTSGMRFLNNKDKQVIDAVPLAESIRNDLLEPLLFDPGTRYQYSNEGIDTAGRIIEIVSGMPYEKFLQERLFAPLGMTNTSFWLTPAQMQRLARSYRTTDDKTGLQEIPIKYLKQPLDGPGRYPAPGGGLFSSARDVARFCQMLANEGTFEGKTYLSRAAVHEMTTKQTGPLVKESYGFGTSVSGAGNRFGHGGAYKTEMWVDHGLIGVFLVQQAGKWAGGDPGKEFSAAVRKNFQKSDTTSASVPIPATMTGSQVPAK